MLLKINRRVQTGLRGTQKPTEKASEAWHGSRDNHAGGFQQTTAISELVRNRGITNHASRIDGCLVREKQGVKATNTLSSTLLNYTPSRRGWELHHFTFVCTQAAVHVGLLALLKSTLQSVMWWLLMALVKTQSVFFMQDIWLRWLDDGDQMSMTRCVCVWTGHEGPEK